MRFALVFLLVACRPPGYGKGDDVPDPSPDAPAATEDSAPPDDGVIAATCAKAFRLDGHSTATSVWLTGSFIQWSADPAHGAIEFDKGVDGAWSGGYDFPAGPHQYKFIVSGSEWILDPTNPDQIDDGAGNVNSLFLCTP